MIDPTMGSDGQQVEQGVVTRRQFIKSSAAAGAVAGLSAVLPRVASAQGRTIKIGYVSPQTGPLAGFGGADNFVVSGIRKVVGKGLTIKARSHAIEILVRDSQSDPNRAAEVAS